MAEPDPEVVLEEAEAATKAGRYEEALEKHVWYHENALRIQPSQFGVRLTYALTAWYGLGKLYPPALVKMRTVRDESVRRIREEKVETELFADVVALNDLFDEGEKTVELFRWLDANKPDEARQAYFFAWQVLVAQGEYALCGKYLNLRFEFEVAESTYKANLRFAERHEDEGRLDHAEGMQWYAREAFSHRACTVVALLVLNNRKQEAVEYAAKAKEILDDAEFHASLDKALDGAVPERWPPVVRQAPWEEDDGDAQVRGDVQR